MVGGYLAYALIAQGRENKSLKSIITKLEANTVSRESLMSEAEHYQSRRVMQRVILRDQIDMFLRDYGKEAFLDILRELIPQWFTKTVK